MAISTTGAIRAVCDCCGSVQLMDERTDIIGFNGTVVQTYLGGGSGRVKWFACDTKCIGDAVQAAIASKME